MRYHIDTIPVWECFKHEGGCPLCRHRIQTEALLVERALGASVMEPDTRINANRLGFCAKHQAMLFSGENRLAHALLLQSRLDYVKAHLDALFDEQPKGSRALRFFQKEQPQSGFNTLQESCMLCGRLDDSMEQFRYTLLHLFKTDASFRTLYEAAPGICLYDVGPLLNMARRQLKGDMLSQFLAATKALTQKALQKSIDDIDFFTRKFDYRNADLPWGDKRDAVERAVNFLRGACVGASSLPEKKEKKA